MGGEKHDEEKLDWSLLPLKLLQPVVRVLMFGAMKYKRDNWKFVPEAKQRYYSAAMRHIDEWQEGVKDDNESGLPHLAHAICCLVFLMWFEKNSEEND